MLVPIEWLSAYTDAPADIDTFCERMIMSGSNIETAEETAAGIEKVVVGRILSIEKHPDADKLVVCQVDIGQAEPLQVVTGATNVFEGALLPVILDGGRLPDGTVIRRGKLRGVESCGMFCSFKELGYDDKVVPVVFRDGVWILEEGSAAPGAELTEAMQMKDHVVDFEITPNRPDCLSMLGMARESAATFGAALRYPETRCGKESGNAAEHIKVEIRRPDLCRRYVARVVTDVKIAQSPWWMQRRLMHAGMRPINNIVDITNYVMLEYGQPIHAFDIRTLKGAQIIVDTAAEGERFVTLDGTERTLDAEMLLIKDAERGVALAGVMGGLNSEIEDDTRTILVEAANFNEDSIRRTSKRLGLRTEASARFEKGIDPALAAAAADRVCRLIEELGAGTVQAGSVDCYPAPKQAKPVRVRPARINAMLGIELSAEEMEAIFERLEMRSEKDGDALLVTPPGIRLDLESEVDFVEEVARLYGYDRLPVTLPKSSGRSGEPRARRLRDLARDTLVALGLDEIQTYSFVSPKQLDQIALPEDAAERSLIRLINPLGEENSVMRTALLPNLLEVLGRNNARSNAKAAVFELGNTFFNVPGPDGLPQEREALALGAYGPEADFYALKGVVEALCEKLGVSGLRFVSETQNATYHPGRCARLLLDGETAGYLGELHPNVAERYGLEQRVICAEISFAKLQAAAHPEIVYQPLPKYPAVARDIALLIDRDTCVGDVEDVIRANGGEILESVLLFDVYTGVQVPPGKKSAAFSLVYRAEDHTLTDEEVQIVHSRILQALSAQCGASLREI